MTNRESNKTTVSKYSFKFWVFSFIAVFIIPLVVLIVLEIGLRVAGYKYPTTFFKQIHTEDTTHYVVNDKFGWRFFPKSVSRKPTEIIMPIEKDKDTYRIFVFGGSAAQGDPHPEYSFWRILEKLLNDRFEGIQFEVINTAMVSINSHVVYQIAKECVRYEPDFFLVYVGNNEVVGPFGAGTVFNSISPNLFFIRSSLALRTTALGQFLHQSLTSLFSAEEPTTWMGMELFLQNMVRSSKPELEQVYTYFEQNLRDIQTLARDRNIPIIFSKVGTNVVDCPPFASLHKPSLQPEGLVEWMANYEAGIKFEANEAFQDALQAYSKAYSIDSEYANLLYRMGRCYLALDSPETAKEMFYLAQEHDTLRFRADKQINEIISEVGENTDINSYLVDFGKHIQEHSPNKLPGNQYFYEHVHLNFDGNYELAVLMADAINKILPETITAELNETKQNWLHKVRCRRQLAFTRWDTYIILKDMLERLEDPPFLYQLDYENLIADYKNRIDALHTQSKDEAIADAKRIYEYALEREPDDIHLRKRFGDVLLNNDEYDAAIENYMFVYKQNPSNITIILKLGEVCVAQENFDQAHQWFDKGLELLPNDKTLLYQKANAYAKADQQDKAASLYKEIIATYPDYTPALLNLSLIIISQQEFDKAIPYLEKILSYDEKNKFAHNFVGVCYAQSGDLKKAEKHFQQAVLTDPEYEQAYQNLLRARSKQQSN